MILCALGVCYEFCVVWYFAVFWIFCCLVFVFGLGTCVLCCLVLVICVTYVLVYCSGDFLWFVVLLIRFRCFPMVVVCFVVCCGCLVLVWFWCCFCGFLFTLFVSG